MNPINKIKAKVRSLVDKDLKGKLNLSEEQVNFIVESSGEAFQNSIEQLGGWTEVLPKLTSNFQGVASEIQSVYPTELANVLQGKMEENIRDKVVNYFSQKVPDLLKSIGGRSAGILTKIKQLLGF